MKENQSAEPAKQVLTNKEFCERYGVGLTTLWKLRKDKRRPLPHFHVGGQVRYRLVEVEEYFASTK